MRIVVIAAALGAVGLGACATITKGTTQVVTINTPGVQGAACVVSTVSGPQTVGTPGVINLNKSSAALPVRCTKECYQDGIGIIGSSTEVMTAGNLIVGGVVGLGVDAMSGAMNKYPDEVQILMIPIQGCRPPPAPRR